MIIFPRGEVKTWSDLTPGALLGWLHLGADQIAGIQGTTPLASCRGKALAVGERNLEPDAVSLVLAGSHMHNISISEIHAPDAVSEKAFMDVL